MTQSVFENLKEQVGRHRDLYAGAFCQLTVTYRSNEWKLTNGVISFDIQPQTSITHSYSNFKYVAEWKSVEDAIDLIHCITCVSRVDIGDLEITTAGRFNEYRSHPGESLSYGLITSMGRGLPFSGQPFYLYEWSLDDRHNPPSGDLWSTDQPYYPSAADLIYDLMGIDQQTGYSSSVVARVPHFHARMVSLHAESTGFEVNIDPQRSNVDDLQLHYYAWSGDRPKGKSGHEVFESNILQIPLDQLPRRLYAVLSSRSTDEIFDIRRYDVELPAQSDLQDISLDLIRELAQQGEGRQLEYKADANTDPAKKELAETVVAFANTDGGVILVGVDDKGSVNGIRGDHLDDKFTNIINSRCDPVPEVPITIVDLDNGMNIAVLRVPESDNKPHFLRGSYAYIRRGATDMPMQRSDFDKMYEIRRGPERFYQF